MWLMGTLWALPQAVLRGLCLFYPTLIFMSTRWGKVQLSVTGAAHGRSRREESANIVHSGQETGREPV
jgi:hypothetical protein